MEPTFIAFVKNHGSIMIWDLNEWSAEWNRSHLESGIWLPLAATTRGVFGHWPGCEEVPGPGRGWSGHTEGGQEMSCPAIDNYPLFPPNCCWLLLIFNIKLPPANYLITDYGAARLQPHQQLWRLVTIALGPLIFGNFALWLVLLLIWDK